VERSAFWGVSAHTRANTPKFGDSPQKFPDSQKKNKSSLILM